MSFERATELVHGTVPAVGLAFSPLPWGEGPGVRGSGAGRFVQWHRSLPNSPYPLTPTPLPMGEGKRHFRGNDGMWHGGRVKRLGLALLLPLALVACHKPPP